MIKQRIIFLCLTIICIFCGLASRILGGFLPHFLETYLPDTLWACMVYFGLSMLFPKSKLSQRFIWALSFCYFIECTQLYQADWINSLRNTTLGGLVLGFGFLWEDIVCYTIGILIPSILEKTIREDLY